MPTRPGDAAKTLGSAWRWPVLILVALFGLAILYRYAPSREKPQWKWFSAGALTAATIWLAGSALFSVYAGHFGNYNKTYGSLAAPPDTSRFSCLPGCPNSGNVQSFRTGRVLPGRPVLLLCLLDETISVSTGSGRHFARPSICLVLPVRGSCRRRLKS
jgi:hypothetical protein